MTYAEFESFIHPDVLSAFKKVQSAINFEITQGNAGEDFLVVSNVDNVNTGFQFVVGDMVLNVKDVDSVANKLLLTTTLTEDVPVGTAISQAERDYSQALKNFWSIGENDYSTFAKSLADYEVPVRFSQDVYILKSAMMAMYKWLLQNKAVLRDINLTGLGVPKSQVFDHFYKLLEMEKEEYNAMREEAMEELKRKQDYEANGQSGKGFLRYNAPNRSRLYGYRRR